MSIIPLPKSYVKSSGSFILSEEVRIKTDFDLELVKDYAVLCDDAPITIRADSTIGREGYTLKVTESSVDIAASTETGAYYALQTMRKLGKTDMGNRRIPCCEISDEPRFKWRGINLDESRHFFGKDVVKRLLDMMFLQKLNVFHWHLTDDNGWRIEIKKYPLLTEIGSKRKYTQIGGWESAKIDNTPHEGFYTREDIKEIIDYAAKRGIMVVPEIDFPAHCAAAIAAYNDLACRNIKSEVFGFFGGLIPEKTEHNKNWNRTLCCGKDSTFEFIYNVLDEVCELFDAPYIHVGGDEAPTDEWEKCPHCQKVMRENGFNNESQLQGWLTNKLNTYLKAKGKKLIGWNEILKADNLDTKDKNIVVQYWTPERDENAENYVNNGGNMIMSNHQSFYFDMPYAQYPLKNTYAYSPQKFGVNSGNVSNVLGIEGELWTEWIADRNRLDMLAFPRMEAMAEVAWSPEEKLDYDDFLLRLEDEKDLLMKLGINYAVDKISMPDTSEESVSIIKSKFYEGNPYLEVELNKEYKAKGER